MTQFDPNDPNIPPEMRSMLMMQQYGQQQHKDMAEQMRDQTRANMAEFVEFINGLNEKQALSFQKLQQSLDGDVFRQVVFGLTAGIIIKNFGRNFFGESADDEMAALAEEQDIAIAEGRLIQNLNENAPGWQMSPEDMPEVQYESLPDADPSDSEVAVGGERWYYLLEQYNLAYNPETGEYQCGGCRAYVHSLKDRMLRDPGVDGCPSCQQKAKWGGGGQ